MIGASKDQPGVHSGMVEPLRDFLYTSFFKGITMDYSEFTDTAKAAQESAELTIRRNRQASKSRFVDPAKANEDRTVVSVLEP